MIVSSKNKWSFFRFYIVDMNIFVSTRAIGDTASPRPKMYWTRTFEGLVPSLGTTSNAIVTSTDNVYYGKPHWTKVVQIFLFKSRFFIQVKNSFFKVRVSIFKSRSFLFKLRCFKWRFFFHVEIFISSREFFRTSRFLSQVENFFSCREFFHAKVFPFKSRF